jgi:membrane-associated phospholipid phosphatase
MDRALLALAGACVVVAVVLQVLAVQTTEGQRLDDAARGNLTSGSPTAVIDATSDLLDTISTASLFLLGAGIMAIALLRGRRLLALGAGVVVLGANLTTQLLKQEVGRPDLLPSSLPNGSFPSGHVTVAMSLAMALVLVAPPALRWWAAGVGMAYAIGVGVAVVLLDWHRPSDVLGAYLVTVTWTALVAVALLSAPDAGGLAESRPRRPAGARAAGALIVALGAVFGVIVGVQAARRIDLLRVVHDRTAFASAAIVCAASCAVLAIVVTALIQRAASPPGRAPGRLAPCASACSRAEGTAPD